MPTVTPSSVAPATQSPSIAPTTSAVHAPSGLKDVASKLISQAKSHVPSKWTHKFATVSSNMPAVLERCGTTRGMPSMNA